MKKYKVRESKEPGVKKKTFYILFADDFFRPGDTIYKGDRNTLTIVHKYWIRRMFFNVKKKIKRWVNLASHGLKKT